MRIHFLEHVPFETPANVGAWAIGRGHEVAITRLHAGDTLPPLDAFDWLVGMGGPMGVNDEDQYAWIGDEKAFLRAAFDAGKAYVGVCLGAQMAAAALGAEVARNEHVEIGWMPVALTDDGAASPLLEGVTREFTAFHWHGDRFEIPDGARLLARSEACAHQAFLWGDRVLGLQFHLDYSADSIELMLEHCGHELIDAPFIQSAAAIRDRIDETRQTKLLLETILDNMELAVGG